MKENLGNKNMFEYVLTLFYMVYRKYIFLKNEDIDELTENLVHQVINSAYEPDIAVAILQEGLIPAKAISKKLGLKLATIGFASYSLKLFGIEMEHFPIIKRIAKLFGYRKIVNKTKKLDINVKNKRILLIDNDSVEGKTMKLALKELNKYRPKEIKTAVLCKYHGLDILNFCAVNVYNKKGLEKRHRMMPWNRISPYYVTKYDNSLNRI